MAKGPIFSKHILVGIDRRHARNRKKKTEFNAIKDECKNTKLGDYG